MAAAGFTKCLFNAFEQALSGDLNRIQNLSSRELQNWIDGNAGRDSLYDIATGNPRPQPFFAEQSIQGQHLLCGFIQSGTTLELTVTAGEGFATLSGPFDPDDAEFAVVRIPTVVLTLTPDGANPRAAIVYATPGRNQTSPINRNILIDPVTRTVQTQIVNKTENPLAIVTLVHGTPGVYQQNGAGPLPPAFPAGSLPLFEIFIPAAATNAGQCDVIRRSDRLRIDVLNNYHGQLQGTFFFGQNGNEAVADNAGPDTLASFPIRAIIDGELVQTTLPMVATNDTIGGQNPFSVAAPANEDQPFYAYLCGGRHLFQYQGRGGTPAIPGFVSPMVIVRSTIFPDSFGHPSANIGTPRGNTRAGALYIGIGFKIKGTTRAKAVYWEDDWVMAASGDPILHLPIPTGQNPIHFGQVVQTVGPITTGTFTLAQVPQPTTKARCIFAVACSALTTGTHYLRALLFLNNGAARQVVTGMTMPVSSGGFTPSIYEQQEFTVNLSGGFSPFFTIDMQSSDATLANLKQLVAAVAYNMRVPKLSAAL